MTKTEPPTSRSVAMRGTVAPWHRRGGGHSTLKAGSVEANKIQQELQVLHLHPVFE